MQSAQKCENPSKTKFKEVFSELDQFESILQNSNRKIKQEILEYFKKNEKNLLNKKEDDPNEWNEIINFEKIQNTQNLSEVKTISNVKEIKSKLFNSNSKGNFNEIKQDKINK